MELGRDLNRLCLAPSPACRIEPIQPRPVSAPPPLHSAAPPAPTLAPERAGDRSGVAFSGLVLGAVAMGASPIFVRLAEVGPFASAFWRVALALPALWLWARLEQSGGARGVFGGFSRVMVLAGVFFAGDLFFWHLAILNTTVANATFFATMSPVLVLAASWVLWREPVGGRTLAGLAACLLGGGLLIGTSLRLAPERLFGDLAGLVTAAFFAGYIMTIGRARIAGGGAGRITFQATLVTTLVLLVVALLLEDRLWPASGRGVLALVALALVSHVGGQGLLSFSLGHLPAGFSSLVIFLEGVAAAALGWLVLGEILTPLQVLGASAIFAGVFLARPARKRRRP